MIYLVEPDPRPRALLDQLRGLWRDCTHWMRMRPQGAHDIVDRAVDQVLAHAAAPAGALVVTVTGDPSLLPPGLSAREARELADALAAAGWPQDPSRVVFRVVPLADRPVTVDVAWEPPRPRPFLLEGTRVRFASDAVTTRYHAGRGPRGHRLHGRTNDIALPGHLLFVGRDAFALLWRDGLATWVLDVPGAARANTAILRHGRTLSLCGDPLPLRHQDVLRIWPLDGTAALALTFLHAEATP